MGCVPLSLPWYVLHDRINGALDQKASQQIGINPIIGHSLDRGGEHIGEVWPISERLFDLTDQGVDGCG